MSLNTPLIIFADRATNAIASSLRALGVSNESKNVAIIAK